MADEETTLPEGTDRVIAGAATASSANEERMIMAEPDSNTATASSRGAMLDKVRSGGNKLADQAAEKTRGFVGQGLERGSEALANVSKLVGDTASGLDERLGSDYGDYARKAASAIEDAANKLAAKDADELIEDTRAFVRKSPGVALAGAAVVGFALARLIKTGLDGGRGDDDA